MNKYIATAGHIQTSVRKPNILTWQHVLVFSKRTLCIMDNLLNLLQTNTLPEDTVFLNGMLLRGIL